MTANDQVRAQLERIAAHDLFASSERRARLLRFLVENSLTGKPEALKESVIAVEVFARPTGHDPKLDSVVRVEMGRLRSKLLEYYARDGKDDPLLIEIPKGGYAPVFTPLKPQGTETQPAPATGNLTAAGTGSRWKAGKWLIAGLALAAIPFAALIAWRRIDPPASPSVAVLPFLNLTGDPANDSLTDGITDELTGVLAEARSLRVVARTSAFQFKGKGADIREIGRTLGAGAVLEGSIQGQEDNWRIVAQLIRTSDGYHLWAHSFDTSPKDLQKTEGEVAQATVRSLAGNQTEMVASSLLMSTKNPEAHDLALRARSAFLRGTLESVALSAQLADQASAKDPSYPVAYYLRGLAQSTMGRIGILPSKTALERALGSLEKAIQLNPAYGDAHAAHAVEVYFYHWDWPKAEEELKLALSLGASQGPNLYGGLLQTRGRFKEAHRQLDRAIELDPVGFAPRLNRAGLWAFEGDGAHARADYQRVLEQNPREVSSILGMVMIDLREKNCAAATNEALKLDELGPELPFSRTTRAWLWAQCGKAEQARRLRDELDSSPPPGLSYFGMGLIDAALGEQERAYAHFNQAADLREPLVLSIKMDPAWKPFHHDPGYIALVKRLRLDE